MLEARFYRVWPGNAIGVRGEKPIARGEWQHVTVTYDGSSTPPGCGCILNGEKLPTHDLARPHAEERIASLHMVPATLTLGERFRDRGFRDGEIDELRIYDRALTPLEVRNLHDGKRSPRPCRPIHKSTSRRAGRILLFGDR